MKMKMKMKTNITKRHLRKIIKEEIGIAIKAMIELEEYSDLKQRDINKHEWAWKYSKVPVCKGDEEGDCIPKALATQFINDEITREEIE